MSSRVLYNTLRNVAYYHSELLKLVPWRGRKTVLDVLVSFIPNWLTAELFHLTLQHPCWGQNSVVVDTDPCNTFLLCFAGKQKHPGPYILRWRPHTCSSNVTSDIERTTTVQVWKSVADFVILSPCACLCVCGRACVRIRYRISSP